MNFELLKENLISKGYEVSVFPNTKEAKEYLLANIKNKSIGIGGSKTIDDLNIYDDLAKNNTVYWHWKETGDVLTKAMNTDIYISSANAVSVNGEIVNIDCNGNRVASTIYGHQKVYFIIGKNKITNSLDEAIYRARNVASPLNAKRLNKKTPCVIDLKCHDCKSPDRICRALSVLYEKINKIDFEVVLIDEDLGY